MGRIRVRRASLIDIIHDTIGYKSGIIISPKELLDLIGEQYPEIFEGDSEDVIVIRSEIVQDATTQILYALGNISNPDADVPGLSYYAKIMNDPEKVKVFEGVLGAVVDILPRLMEDAANKGTKEIDPTLLIQYVAYKYPHPDAQSMLFSIVSDMQLAAHMSVDAPFRLVEWKDTVELRDLFHSESLDTQYGTFLDQRYIDYLDRNFEKIDNMNWRKFEGLTAEFFGREGYYVEIGAGRNDESIDVRVWPKEEDKALPPLILIQCKRQKSKVEKVIVKALWADVVDANAKSGMIVTTSRLAPGAARVCEARSYPITQANRETLKEWIGKMRSGNNKLHFEGI